MPTGATGKVQEAISKGSKVLDARATKCNDNSEDSGTPEAEMFGVSLAL